jgi:hypothetical protein
MVASTVGKLSALLAADLSDEQAQRLGLDTLLPLRESRASWRLSCAARRIASSEWPPRAKKSASISFTSQPRQVTPGQVMVASTVGKLSALLAADLSDEQAQRLWRLSCAARRIASSEWPPRAKKSASISFTSQPSSCDPGAGDGGLDGGQTERAAGGRSQR